MGATSSSVRRKCFAHAAGQLVAHRKGRAGLSGQALCTSKFLIPQLTLCNPLQSGWNFREVQVASLGVAVHSADWQARVWVDWHIKRTINKSAQDRVKGWRIWAPRARRMRSHRSTCTSRLRPRSRSFSWTSSPCGCRHGWTREGLERRCETISASVRPRENWTILKTYKTLRRHPAGFGRKPAPLDMVHTVVLRPKTTGATSQLAWQSRTYESSLSSEGHWRSNGSQSTARCGLLLVLPRQSGRGAWHQREEEGRRQA